MTPKSDGPPSSPNSQKPRSSVSPPLSTKPSRGKIMVVDDSEIVREAVAVNLEAFGYQVVALQNLFSFVQALETERQDLVLVDVNMPALSGDKLIEIARRHQTTHSCRMVLFSDRRPEHLARLAEACGAAGYISKTSDSESLARACASFMRPSTPRIPTP
jgi:two-component system OmpR family response regulator